MTGKLHHHSKLSLILIFVVLSLLRLGKLGNIFTLVDYYSLKVEKYFLIFIINLILDSGKGNYLSFKKKLN